jgi:hypothetical protein
MRLTPSLAPSSRPVKARSSERSHTVEPKLSKANLRGRRWMIVLR